MADTVEIAILNQKFLLKKGKSNETYIRSLENYVNHKMKEIQAKTPSVATTNIAILVALNIADEYFRQKLESDSRTEDIQQEIKRLIGSINETLKV